MLKSRLLILKKIQTSRVKTREFCGLGMQYFWRIVFE